MKRALQFIPVIMSTILSGCGSPTDVVVGVAAPLSVEKGEEFVIVATVENTASRQQKLVSLDIADAYLDGIAIMETEPDHKEATHVPLDNTMSYVFDLPIAAGRRVEVRLHAKAIAQGDYNAEIDFCINSGTSFLSRSLRTVVE